MATISPTGASCTIALVGFSTFGVRTPKSQDCIHFKRMTPGRRAEGGSDVPGVHRPNGIGVRAAPIRLVGIVEVTKTNDRRPACSAPRSQPASCNAQPSANSGHVFRMRECKAQRRRDTPPPDHDNVALNVMDSA
jgi:hypothetical protein